MIFDTLILHDFGQYGGRVHIDLTPPSPEQPIILFGGLNGAGKTTLLDAIQLCLFGRRAPIPRREAMGYEAFLAGAIHRGGGATSASVELHFRHMSNGVEQSFVVRRSWRRTAKGCPEKLSVRRNGQADTMATDNWAEQVEEYLPSRIAHLFLFDGEQIGAYADPRSACALIEAAVYNLLGLDLVEKLDDDLAVIERRNRQELLPEVERDRLAALEAIIAERKAAYDACHSRHAKRAADLGRLAAQREAHEAQFREEGGHLYDRRREIEAQAEFAEQRLRSCERALREAAAGAAPLLLIESLLARTVAQAHKEARSAEAVATDALLTARDATLLGRLGASDPELVGRVAQFLDADRAERRAAIATPLLRMTELGRDRLRNLNEEELQRTRAALPPLLSDYALASDAFGVAKDQVAAIPSVEAIEALARDRQEMLDREAALLAEQRAETEMLDRLRREVERARNERQAFMAGHKEAELAEDDRARVLRHVGKVRHTLSRFRGAVIRRHLSRIETLVLDSFKQLLRKKTLIAALQINPDNFALELTARDGASLSPDQLSAGERQLLAVSVLWGLARASGRPLPMVIDTPLGRLDSSHRRRLVTHYFPQASHQLLLLSTDEEIAGGYWEALKPYVGRVYRLAFDEAAGQTRVEPGYFEAFTHVD